MVEAVRIDGHSAGGGTGCLIGGTSSSPLIADSLPAGSRDGGLVSAGSGATFDVEVGDGGVLLARSFNERRASSTTEPLNVDERLPIGVIDPVEMVDGQPMHADALTSHQSDDLVATTSSGGGDDGMSEPLL